MVIRLQLVPTWQHAWKWLSVQSAAMLVLLGGAQTYAQAFEADSRFAFITHSTWYHAAMTALAAATIVLRLVHQPATAATPPLPEEAACAPAPDLRADKVVPTPLPDPPHETFAFPEQLIARYVFPKAKVASSPVAVPIPSPKEQHMSMHANDWASLLSAAVQIFSPMVEGMNKPDGTALSGTEKHDAVKTVVQAAVPAAPPTAISLAINGFVALANLFPTLWGPAATQAAAATTTQPAGTAAAATT